MTAEEYKKQHPEHKDLEGAALWDAMEDAMLRQQTGQVYITHMLPWYKRYKLRYLFYIRKRNATFVKPYESQEMCKWCKKGVSFRLLIMDFSGQTENQNPCPHCNKELGLVPNTTMVYKLSKLWRATKVAFWNVVEFTHIVRHDTQGRYDMFGDESHYVKGWIIKNDGTTTPIFRERKWWEYIVIQKH